MKETAVSVLSYLPETGEQVAQYVGLFIDEARGGNVDLMVLKRRLKAAGDAIKMISEALDGDIIDEARKYATNAGDFSCAGAKYRLGVRNTYDYKSSNWSKHIEALKTVKECEEMLKAAKAPFVDPETGEEVQPPTFKSTEVLTVVKY